jgi:hypothetical protein
MSEDFNMWTDFSGEPFNSLRKQVEDLETDQMKLNFLTENIEYLKRTISLDGVYPLDIEIAIRWGEDKITGLKYLLERNASNSENQQTEKPKEVLENSKVNANETVTKKTTYSPSYPIIFRNQIIEAAVFLTEKTDTWTESDLIGKLGLSKATLDRQKRHFNLKIRQIRNEAKEMILKKAKEKDTKK